MYFDYIKEKEDIDNYQWDWGFMTYCVEGGNIFHVVDIYIKPEFRGQGKVHELIEKAKSIGREKGCTKISSEVYVLNKPEIFDRSKALLERYGILYKDDEKCLMYVQKL